MLTHIVEKMVETILKWFEHAERKHVDFVVRRVKMRWSQITRGWDIPRKIIREAIMKDLKMRWSQITRGWDMPRKYIVFLYI